MPSSFHHCKVFNQFRRAQKMQVLCYEAHDTTFCFQPPVYQLSRAPRHCWERQTRDSQTEETNLLTLNPPSLCNTITIMDHPAGQVASVGTGMYLVRDTSTSNCGWMFTHNTILSNCKTILSMSCLNQSNIYCKI